MDGLYVYIYMYMENPTKMDDLEVRLFYETLISYITHIVPYLNSDIRHDHVPMAMACHGDMGPRLFKGRVACSTRPTLVETNDTNSSSKHLETLGC